MREQLTFFKEPVLGVSAFVQPSANEDVFTFLTDVGGDGSLQRAAARDLYYVIGFVDPFEPTLVRLLDGASAPGLRFRIKVRTRGYDPATGRFGAEGERPL